MSFKFFFLMYEVIRLVVCQSKIKIKKKKIQGNAKGHFLKKKNGDFLNCRNMIVLITLFIDFII